MPLSEEVRSRWRTYLDTATTGSVARAQVDEHLYEFVAYALIYEPEAMEDRSALYALMREYTVSEFMMNRVFHVLDAAPGLIAAHEQERGNQHERVGPTRSRRTAVAVHPRMVPARSGDPVPA